MKARVPDSIVGTERRPDCSLLDNGQLRRQGARPELNGEIISALDREVAGDLPRTAEDRLADHRSRQHLVIEHDGERSPDVLLSEAAERARARLVEAKGNDRLVGPLVEAGLRIHELIAANHGGLAQQVNEPILLSRGIDPVTRRRARTLRLETTDARVDLMEAQSRRLADESLELRRVLQSRELNQDAVGTLPDHRRFGSSERVNASANRLDGSANGVGDPLLQTGFGGL